MKNRHISLQLIKAVEQIKLISLSGWFCIDIISDSGNDNPTDHHISLLRLKFSRLDKSKTIKWIFVLKDGHVVNIGEY
jgi:hypothetical protein